MRKLLVLFSVLFLLVPTAAVATPDGQRGRGADRLDLYEVTGDAGTEAELREDGFEVVAAEPAQGDQVTLEMVLTDDQAEALREEGEVDVELKRNEEGLSTAQAATLEAQSGFEVWRTYSEPGGIKDEMELLARQYDRLTELITIGESLNGQPIYAMRVTADADRVKDGKRPAVLYVSTQHAREWISTEVNRRLLRHFLENYGSDRQITDLVADNELWFILVVNPDGYDHTFTEGNRLWRKNLRDNNGDGEVTVGDGVDEPSDQVRGRLAGQHRCFAALLAALQLLPQGNQIDDQAAERGRRRLPRSDLHPGRRTGLRRPPERRHGLGTGPRRRDQPR